MYYNVFLSYPENYPCKSTIWNFREKLKDKCLMQEIWRIFKEYCVETEDIHGKFVMQDASFYTADKGQKKKNYPSW
jgi:hypothetical protein